MLTDAHLHLADLLERDPGFPERAAGVGPWLGCAASHDEPEFAVTESLAARLAGRPAEPSAAAGLRDGDPRPRAILSFGIHPQWAVWKNADFLASLAASGRIAAIGEAGFDFFGDRPERVRNEANESAQRTVFEYQLDLAVSRGLPMVLHLRKATDLAFEYAPRLGRLPAAIFHSYSGTAREAESLLARGIEAYFSFGATILNGHKRAIEACANVPADRLLSETDAPWQPPRGEEFCRLEHIGRVVEGMAAIRGAAPEALEERLEGNFRRAYGLGAGSAGE
jgi:TatD DNase family protein